MRNNLDPGPGLDPDHFFPVRIQESGPDPNQKINGSESLQYTFSVNVVLHITQHATIVVQNIKHKTRIS